MIGYWIVMAMVTCAVAAVIVASASSISSGSSGSRRTGSGTARSSTRPIVIAALGASDATGEGALDPERENWLAQLAEHLPEDATIQNFGVGGSWLAAAYVAQVPGVVEIEPDIIVGWLIVNDLTQGESLAQYVEILDLSLAMIARSGRPVLLGNAPQLWNLPAFMGDPDDIEELRLEVELWNLSLVQVAAKYGVTIVDLCQNPVEIEDLADDGLHPSAAGHAKLAAMFRPHVLSAIELVRLSRSTDPIE